MDYKKIEKEAANMQLFNEILSGAFETRSGLKFIRENVTFQSKRPVITIEWFEGFHKETKTIPLPFDYDYSKLYDFLDYLSNQAYEDINRGNDFLRKEINNDAKEK